MTKCFACDSTIESDDNSVHFHGLSCAQSWSFEFVRAYDEHQNKEDILEKILHLVQQLQQRDEK